MNRLLSLIGLGMGLCGWAHALPAMIATCPALLGKASATVVVDPFGYQGGELLPETARSRGEKVIVVLSRKDLPAFFTASFDAKGAAVIVHEGDAAATWKKVAAQAEKDGAVVRTVLPGTESGVPVSDAIAEVAGLPGNGTQLSLARRDKLWMHRRLAEARLPHAFSAVVTKEQDLVAFFAAVQTRRVVRWVVKPRQSACTDRVFFVETLEEAKAALREIVGGHDVYGTSDEAAVIQEFLPGTEYIFDTVSTVEVVDGKPRARHLAVGAWRYVRRPPTLEGRAPIIDEVQWVPFDELPRGMAEYAFKVLDAMGMQRGPAHLEIMDTPRGPVLVEIGARLPGGLPLIAAEAAGPEFSHLELALDSFIRPDNILALIAKHGGGYPSVKAAKILFLSVDEAGKKLSPSVRELVQKSHLPSLSSVRVFGKPDTELPLTTDVTNALLRAHLVGTREEIERDARKLRDRHRSGAFYAP